MKCLFVVTGLLLLPSAVQADAKATLEKHGIQVAGSRLFVEGEREFSTQMRRAPKIRKGVAVAALAYANAEHARAALEREIAALTQNHGQLNIQLANVRPGDVTTNNRLVGMINAMAAQINLKQQQLANGKKITEGLRAKASEAREAFIQFALDSRKMADAVEAKRVAAAKDSEVQAALKELNADGGLYSLAEPSRTFEITLKKLADLEERVLSEDVAIRRDPGGTAHVTVTVNGDKSADMVVDSGASVISLPLRTAQELGVQPGPKDPPILLTLADGRQIRGTLVKLKTVRIGQFEVEDVECAVLGPDAVNAEPLLGMSFLQEFEFQINSAKETLTLTRIKEDPRSRSRSRSRRN